MRLLLVAKGACPWTSQICDDRSFVVPADTLDEALSLFRHETFDLVILDVTSFTEGGFAFIRHVRAEGNDTPIVAITGRHAADRTRVLSLGADDAISQPVDSGDLTARIAAVCRRHRGYAQSPIQVGALSLSLDSHAVSFRDIPVRLTITEYAMLELLVLRKGQVVSKERFLNYLYGGVNEPKNKIIAVFICMIRSKLVSVGGAGVIATVWGRGHTIRAIGEQMPASQMKVSAETMPRPAGIEDRAIAFQNSARSRAR